MHHNTGLTTVGHFHPSLLRLALFCVDKVQYSILGFVVSDIARRILLLVISKVCALFCVSKLQRDTTSLVKDTAIETLSTKYQRTKLYSGPPNLADEGWKKREVIAVFDVWLIWLQ